MLIVDQGFRESLKLLPFYVLSVYIRFVFTGIQCISRGAAKPEGPVGGVNFLERIMYAVIPFPRC